jgi:hypothetical protein
MTFDIPPAVEDWAWDIMLILSVAGLIWIAIHSGDMQYPMTPEEIVELMDEL